MSDDTTKEQLRQELEALRRENADLRQRLREFDTPRGDDAYFETLFRDAPLGYQSLDREGRLLDVNTAWLETMGYTRDEVLGHWFGDFLLPDFRDEFRKNFPRFIAAGAVQGVEYELARKDGEVVVLSFAGRIAYRPDGSFRHTHCIMQDVTQQALSLKALEESERKYRLLAENTADIIWTTDEKGRYTYVSPSVIRILGYEPAKALGRSIFGALPLDSARRARAAFSRAASVSHGDDDFQLRVELEHYTHDGGRIWFEVLARPQRDTEGRLTGWLGISRDIGDRKASEDALRHSEARFRNVLENASLIAVALDDQARLTFANKHFLELTGWTREEILGQDWFDHFIPADIRETVRNVFLRTIADRSPGAHSRYENKILAKNGAPITVLWSNTFDPAQEDGSLPGVTCLGVDVSEQQRAETALRLSEQRFRRLFEDASMGILVVRPDSTIADSNKAASDILGHDRDDLLGIRTTTFIHPDDLAVQRAGAVLDRAARQQPQTLERRYRHRDGHYVPVLVNVKYLPDTGQFLVMFQDITESKQAKAELERFRLLLTAMADNMLDMLWAKDTEGRYLFANKAIREGLLHCDDIDPLGRTDTYFALRQRDLGQEHTFGELCFDSDRLVLDSGAPGRFVEDGLVQGEYLALDVQKSPLYDRSGTLIGTVGTGRNITKKLERDRALKKSRQELQLTLDATNDSIWNYVVPTDTITTSLKILEILGYDKGEIDPAQCLADDNLHPDDLGLRNNKLADYMRGEIPEYAAEFRLRAKDGTWKWIYSRGSIVERDGAGQPMRLIGAHTDITELKKVQEDLTLAKETAENATRAKSEFLANMSHELRTPLNGMFGMLQLLQLTELDQEQEEYVQTSLGTGRSLMAIINDVLDFSKMEAGLVEIAMESFDLSANLDMVANNFTVQTREKGLEMKLDVAGDVPTALVGDEGRLRQILFNLVGNAVKFTEQGRVGLSVQRLPFHHRGEDVRLLFTVTDTGIGIPENQILRVFEAFTQADGAYTRRFSGTGLGLGIVRKLVARMNGTMSVESEPGQGTSVYFTLPFTLAPTADSPAPADPRVASRRLRVLLVEDEMVNQMAARMFLTRQGHEVTCASNGRHALEHLEIATFDCVLMDVQMPEMDGIEATRAIRSSNKPYRDVPIIAMTAHAMQKDMETFLAAGMNAHIAKPVDMDKLEQAMAGLTPS